MQRPTVRLALALPLAQDGGVTVAERRARNEARGITERVRREVEAFPPLTESQRARLREIGLLALDVTSDRLTNKS